MEVGSGTIPNTGKFDLVISILWSRLGNLLSPTLRMPDGSTPSQDRTTKLAGRWTSRKEQGRAAVAGFPQPFEPAAAAGTERGARSLRPALGLFQEFFAHWKTNSDGNGVGTFNNYSNLQEFEGLFRGQFRHFLRAR